MSTSGYGQGFSRLRVLGKDRAKFLHNFCTNNIKSLESGVACEAFFVDVKARTLAHGYVAALDDFHEIWMLPGDAEALAKHLNRYVITEDVRVDPISGTTSVYAASPELLNMTGLSDKKDRQCDAGCAVFYPTVSCSSDVSNSSDALILLRFSWAGIVLVGAGGVDGGGSSRESAAVLNSQLLPAEECERLRILERYPAIGRDLTHEHLAPEAERNTMAISYTKGCYLGQEPIARLDAMGHVNRALRTISVRGINDADLLIGAMLKTSEGHLAGTLSSAVRVSDGESLGLAMLRVSSLTQALCIQTESGQTFDAVVQPPGN